MSDELARIDALTVSETETNEAILTLCRIILADTKRTGSTAAAWSMTDD